MEIAFYIINVKSDFLELTVHADDYFSAATMNWEI